MKQLHAELVLDDKNGALYLESHEIAVIYFRAGYVFFLKFEYHSLQNRILKIIF